MNCCTTSGVRWRVKPAVVGGLLLLCLAAPVSEAVAQRMPAPPVPRRKPVEAPVAVAPVVPPDYVIGTDDVLGIVFWREKDMSVDVQVRPDGKITLPLMNDMQAAGLTPDRLREQITAAAGKYVEDPNVTVLVKTMNSRKVFVTGQVLKPVQYPLTGPTTVVQIIALAGGLQEYADEDKILVMRTEAGRQAAYPFNYNDILRGRNLGQNIELKPGDTVIVP